MLLQAFETISTSSRITPRNAPSYCRLWYISHELYLLRSTVASTPCPYFIWPWVCCAPVYSCYSLQPRRLLPHQKTAVAAGFAAVAKSRRSWCQPRQRRLQRSSKACSPTSSAASRMTSMKARTPGLLYLAGWCLLARFSSWPLTKWA